VLNKRIGRKSIKTINPFLTMMRRPVNQLAEIVEIEFAEADVGTFASLSNLKILATHDNPQLLVVERHFLTRALERLVSTIYVDEKWYREKYIDIKLSIEQGVLKSAKDHYTRFGYYEHRMPYDIEIDDDWYLSQYPDVRAAVRREDFPCGQAHFESVGFREGRLPYANFNLRRA